MASLRSGLLPAVERMIRPLGAFSATSCRLRVRIAATRILIGSFLLCVSVTHADSWVLPGTEIYHSRDSNLVVRIDPIRRDQKGVHPTATITKWSPRDHSYHFVRRVALRNPSSPILALITNDARFLVTFDDWFDLGATANAVVIYDLGKGTIHNYRIEDFLPESYRERFRRSTSIITWRGEPFVLEPEHTIYVPLPDTKPDSRGFEPHIEIDPTKNKIWIQKEDDSGR